MGYYRLGRQIMNLLFDIVLWGASGAVELGISTGPGMRSGVPRDPVQSSGCLLALLRDHLIARNKLARVAS
jgi:hypothetical protein